MLHKRRKHAQEDKKEASKETTTTDAKPTQFVTESSSVIYFRFHRQAESGKFRFPSLTGC